MFDGTRVHMPWICELDPRVDNTLSKHYTRQQEFSKCPSSLTGSWLSGQPIRYPLGFPGHLHHWIRSLSAEVLPLLLLLLLLIHCRVFDVLVRHPQRFFWVVSVVVRALLSSLPSTATNAVGNNSTISRTTIANRETRRRTPTDDVQCTKQKNQTLWESKITDKSTTTKRD